MNSDFGLRIPITRNYSKIRSKVNTRVFVNSKPNQNIIFAVHVSHLQNIILNFTLHVSLINAKFNLNFI